jgi:hypothetical protein
VFQKLITFLNRPRLAGALLLFALLFMFAMAYGGRALVSFGLFDYKTYAPQRTVLFFLITLVWWALTTRAWKMEGRDARQLLLVFFLAATGCLFSPEVGSDGSSYYAQLTSLTLDRDLNFYNQIAEHQTLWSENELDSLNRRGYTYIGFPVGPAVFWMPFMAMGHLHAKTLCALGSPVVLDGYSWPYRWWVLGGTVFYGFWGAWLCLRLLRRYASPFASLWGTVLCMLATPLLSYLFIEASFSHALSFALAAAFLVIWAENFDCPAEKYPTSWRPYLALGLCLGLLTLVRWQNLIFGVIPFLDALCIAGFCIRKMKWNWFAEFAVRYITMLIVAALAFLPQIIVWKIIADSWLVMPQGEGYVDWLRPHTLKVLFHPLHGLFIMHPVAAIGLFGSLLLLKKHSKLWFRLGLVFLFQLYVNSVVNDWWAGGAFGQRRMASTFPLIGLGIAVLLDRLYHARSIKKDETHIPWHRFLFGLLVLLLIWNVMLLAQYKIGPLDQMGELRGEIWASVFGQGWKKLSDFIVYKPIFRTIWGGIFQGDPLLFSKGLLATAVFGFGFIMIMRRKKNDGRWPGRLERRWAVGILAAAMLLLLQAQHGAHMTTVVNSRPLQHLGNIVDLTTFKEHRYRGGFSIIELAPGQEHRVDFTRRVVSDSVLVVSYLKEPQCADGGNKAFEIILHQEDGGIIPLTFDYGRDSERFDLERMIRDPRAVGGSLDIARSWKPNGPSAFQYHTYRATRRLHAPVRLVALSIRNTLAAGQVVIEGLAFSHAEVRPAAYQPPSRFMTVPLTTIANADYKHNPFVAHGSYDPHYGFSEGYLFWKSEPFYIPRSAADGGEWSIFTTCGEKTRNATLDVKAQPFERIDFLVCGGLIRKRHQFDVVEVSAHYIDGVSETRVLAANRDVFDYLDPYRNPAKQVVGMERSYQYDGPLQVVSLQLSRPAVPVERISIRDMREGKLEGVTFFAVTAVRSGVGPIGQAIYASDGVDIEIAPTGGYYTLDGRGRVKTHEGAKHYGGLTLPEDYQLATKIKALPGGYIILDGMGALHRFGDVAPLDGVALGNGLAVDMILTDDGKGYYMLDKYGGVHTGGSAQPLGPGPYFGEPVAIDIEWGYQRFGYYILDKSGAVSVVGAAPYYGRATMSGDETAIDMEVFPDGYVIMTSKGRMLRFGHLPLLEEPAGVCVDIEWLRGGSVDNGRQ